MLLHFTLIVRCHVPVAYTHPLLSTEIDVQLIEHIRQ